MKKYINILKNTKLFSGIDEEEIMSMLSCLNSTLRTYKKGEYVFRSGEHLNSIIVLAEGVLHIRRDDYWGNCSIVNQLTAGEMFGLAYVSPDSGALPNDVIATQSSAVIFFDIGRILSVCPSGCRFHSLAVKNLFFAISEKNRALITKLGYMSNRTTREKLLSYLSDEAKKHGGASFTIPFNRQQLADFLSVDRSAMSNELCKMRNEGLLEFEKNKFSLF